jgi:hypothetical protein
MQVAPTLDFVVVEATATNEAALAFWHARGFADRYVELESLPGHPARQS